MKAMKKHTLLPRKLALLALLIVPSGMSSMSWILPIPLVGLAVYETAPSRVAPAAPDCTVQFVDVDSQSPFYVYIHELACRGVLNGYADGTFRSGDFVTRGQVAKMLVNALGLV